MLALSLTVCFPVLLSAIAKAEEDHESSTSATSKTMPQAHVSTATIKLPIVDGTDIRFARSYTGDGLSQTKVAQIVQDDQGFMWFGTQYGLNRFDGYNFKVFVHDPRNPNSLSGVFINALFKDRTGTLWVGCDQFLNKFDRKTERFTQYAVPSVYHISQDTTGVLWLATTSGLYELDPATGRIRRFSHDPNDPLSLSSNDVKSSGEDKTGRFWVTNSEGLDEFDRGTGKVKVHVPLRESSNSFYEDRFGVFWIFGNALAVFDRNTNTLTHYSFHERKPPGRALTGVTAMLEDPNGTLWLATRGAGLLKFDRDHRRFIRYRNNPGDPESLLQNNVESLFVDMEGNIWAGLGRMGLVRFGGRPLPFGRFPHLDAPNNTLQPFVGAIYEDRKGILWIGTPATLNRIVRKTERYTYYRRTAEPAATTDVITICEDRSDNLWVGTYGHGLLRFNRQTGHFKTYRHDAADPYSLSNDIVTRLIVDQNGTLWAATFDGLNRFDAATERFTTYKSDSQSKTPHYLELVEDREGALWLGTDSSGLQRFDPATGQFADYQQDMNRQGTLSDNRVNSVHFDRTGTMWVGTQDGLNNFDPRTGRFTVYTQSDGLPGNAVGCILEDDHSDLWMSTNNGVARFDPQKKVFKPYSTADGLPGPDLTGWGACFKSVAGEMFFGGFSGATAFFPEMVSDSAYAPPIVLTDFRLLGTGVALGAGSPLKKTINYTNSITLSHEQNVFSIGFSALSYSNAATNRYRYMLEGLDQQWNEVGSEHRYATYTTLPAGIYIFRVQGATSGGVWTEPSVQIRIEILPAWWNAFWFRASFGAVLLLVGLATYNYRLHQIATTMKARFDERLAERTRMARDLHDTFLQTIQGSKLVADDALDEPTDPVRMHRAIEKLSEWLGQATQEGRAALNSLRTSTTETNDLAEALQRTTEDCPVPGSMAVNFSVVGDAQRMHPIVRDEIYRIGYEAIRNACMHSSASKLEVELIYSQDLALRVADNGVGIDSDVADQGKDGHFGLQGMRERAVRISGKLTLVSSPNSGTEIKLIVPGGIVFQKTMPVRRFQGIRTLFRSKDDTPNLD